MGIKTPYSTNWLENRADEMKTLLNRGIVPQYYDMHKYEKAESEEAKQKILQKAGGEMPTPSSTHLCGQVAGAINDILPAKTIIEEMVETACKTLQANLANVSWPAARL